MVEAFSLNLIRARVMLRLVVWLIALWVQALRAVLHPETESRARGKRGTPEPRLLHCYLHSRGYAMMKTSFVHRRDFELPS